MKTENNDPTYKKKQADKSIIAVSLSEDMIKNTKILGHKRAGLFRKIRK